MAETLHITDGDKAVQYRALLPQLEALVEGEDDLIANMANVAAALRMQFSFFWVGFYLVKDEALVLGPFQGPIACTRIAKGKGVCGTVWARGETLIVSDVEAFPGHIACSSLAKSEIVVPIYKQDEIIAVLDVDSDQPDHFDETDAAYLARIAGLL